MNDAKRFKRTVPTGDGTSAIRDVVLASDFDAAQSELAALREELANHDSATKLINAWVDTHGKKIPWDKAIEIIAVVTKMPDAERKRLLCIDDQYELVSQRLTAAEQRNAELQKQIDSIDKHLRGNVNDPDPLPLIMPGAASYTTTYGLVAGLRRERDYLKKSATPLPAGDDYLRQLAQRLREYVRNPHHIDPISEAFKRLIDDSAFALSKLSALKPTESGASGSTCNQIREESGLPINNPCIACKNGACIDK